MQGAPSAGEWLIRVRERVDARLVQYLESKHAEAVAVSPESVVLVDAIRSLTMRGGKRLRPAVLTAAYLSIAPDGSLDATIDAAASLELLQSYLLIHDDWMDQDDVRRGGPSVHAMLRDVYGDAHLGASMAILTGDLASAYAWELILAAPFPPDRRDDGLRVYLKTQLEVFFGQHLDMAGSADVERMHHLKTGSYTVRGPLLIGAILGGASRAQLDALERFGTPVGHAFQLRDDLLGTFGLDGTTGKSSSGDLKAGKRTSLLREAERMLSAPQRADLDAVLGNTDAGEEHVAKAADLLVACGVRTRVEEQIVALLEEAEHVLEQAPLHEKGVVLLRELATMMAIRDR